MIKMEKIYEIVFYLILFLFTLFIHFKTLILLHESYLKEKYRRREWFDRLMSYNYVFGLYLPTKYLDDDKIGIGYVILLLHDLSIPAVFVFLFILLNLGGIIN